MPRNITVTFADGTSHVYQGAPDDVTPDQVETRAAKEFGKKVKALDGGRGSAAPEPSMLDSIKQGAGNLVAGAVRGAGSIGATILAPVDMISDAIDGKGLSLESNRQRRRDMDEGLRMMGADTDSMLYKGGKLTGEIAGTAGAGGVVANALGRSATVAANAPNVLQAIRTAGMSAGNAMGATNALVRATGGAVSGGVSAGMVDPSEATTGAAVGAVLPGALKVAGMAGRSVGRVLRGPEQAADVAQAVQAARGAGYVIPPTQARPTLGNRLLEGFSGKLTTQQNASAANQGVTNRLAAESLGLAGDTKLTPDVLTTVRKQAGQAFESLRNTGTVQADQTYDKALNGIVAKYKGASGGFPGLDKPEVENLVTTLRQPIFSSDAAVDAVRVLREKADAAYGAGDKGLGKAIKEAASALEDQLERHLAATNQPASVLAEFRDARKLIAKTYTVEKALNKETGTVSAQKLAAELNKGKPLSDELESAARFAARFPKASQTTEAMGSLPQLSPLDFALGAGMSASTMNPLMMASVMARPGARALALSPGVQNRLVQPQGNRLAALVNPSARQLAYRSAPVALAGDQ